MAQQDNHEDDISKAIKESLQVVKSRTVLFAGLESISEEEQVARLLILSAQEATISASKFNNTTAAVSHPPRTSAAASTSFNDQPSPQRPKDKETTWEEKNRRLRENFEEWKRLSVTERAALFCSGNVVLDQLAERTSQVESKSSTSGRDLDPQVEEPAAEEIIDPDLLLAIELSQQQSDQVDQDLILAQRLNEQEQRARVSDPSRTRIVDVIPSEPARIVDVIPSSPARPASGVRLQDFTNGRLSEEEELTLALRLSRDAAIGDEASFFRHHQPAPVNPTSIYNPERQRIVPGSRRLIVIDGCNVGHAHAHHRAFSFRGVLICIEFFQLKQHQVVVFLPPGRYNNAAREDQETMDNLLQENILVLTPRRRLPDGTVLTSYDDLFIIKFAAERKGIIVSNDQYRDVKETNPEYLEQINKRVLPFTWHEDTFMIADDPLGRSGPTIEQFLTHHT